jgi:hydrogenase maturation protein HypF
MLAGIAADVEAGRPTGEIAAAFHRTLAEMFATSAAQVRGETGIETVALSGGVFQNRLFLRLMRDALRRRGFSVLSHQQVPANDGGLSLGQAAAALHQPS